MEMAAEVEAHQMMGQETWMMRQLSWMLWQLRWMLEQLRWMQVAAEVALLQDPR